MTKREATERLLPRVGERESGAVVPEPIPRARPTWPERILLATDGSWAADTAITTAQMLERRHGASIQMLAIYAPRIPMPSSPDRRGFAQCEAQDRGEAARLLGAVRAQRMRLLPARHERANWPLRLAVGDPGSTIVRVAQEISADLVVVGIGQPEPANRHGSGHTAMRVVRYSTVPLYAAADGAEVPARCVVALPDGLPHTPTLRAAVRCLLPGSRMWLALPDNAATPALAGGESATAREVVMGACGAELADEIDAIEIEHVRLSGDMLVGVLRLANDVDAQLIAIPNGGDPGTVRVFLPNLAEPVLLGARCSVLVVPDPLV